VSVRRNDHVQGIVCICKKTFLKPPILVGMIELLTLQAIEAEWGVYQSISEWVVYQSGQLARILSSFRGTLGVGGCRQGRVWRGEIWWSAWSSTISMTSHKHVST